MIRIYCFEFQILTIFYKVASLIALNPLYNFTINKFSAPTFNKIIAFLNFTFLAYFSTKIYWMFIQFYSSSFLFTTTKVLFFLQIAIYLVFGCRSSLMTSIGDYDEWKTLFGGMRHVEVVLFEKEIKNNSSKPWLLGCMFVSSILLVIPVALLFGKLQLDFFHQTLGVIQLYGTLYSNFLVVASGLVIKHNYIGLNKFLKGNLQKYSNKKWINKSDHRFCEEIRLVGKLYRILHEVLLAFNKTFGWRILAQFSFSWIIFLNLVNKVGMLLYASKRDSVVFTDYSINFICLVLMGCMVLICNGIDSESRKIFPIIHRFQEVLPYDAPEREELFILAKEVDYFSVNISAAGLFQVNNSTMLSFIGAATTYLIVLISFNKNQPELWGPKN